MEIEPEAVKVEVVAIPEIKLPKPIVPPEIKAPSVTTFEEDRTTAGQRRVNMIWEFTQAIIAIFVTVSSLIVASVLAIRNSGEAAFLLLSNGFFLIIGFYFSRTNHTKVGGTGAKEGKER